MFWQGEFRAKRDIMTKIIMAFGELLWDLLPNGPMLGGAPFNFAYRANSLENNALIVSRLGRDRLGRRAFEEFSDIGMDTKCLQWDDMHPTGTVKINFPRPDVPDYSIVPNVAYDFIAAEKSLLIQAARADCLYFGTLCQRSGVSHDTCRKILGATSKAVKFLDINLRKDCYSKQVVIESIKNADIVKLNDEEARQIADMLALNGETLPEIVVELTDRYDLDCCIITMGASGVLAASPQQLVFSPAYQVDLADTVGAGDAFAAGFIHKYLRGKPLALCCQYGNAFGALVASQHGATAPGSRAEIKKIIKAGKIQPIPSQFTALGKIANRKVVIL